MIHSSAICFWFNLTWMINSTVMNMSILESCLIIWIPGQVWEIWYTISMYKVIYPSNSSSSSSVSSLSSSSSISENDHCRRSLKMPQSHFQSLRSEITEANWCQWPCWRKRIWSWKKWIPKGCWGRKVDQTLLDLVEVDLASEAPANKEERKPLTVTVQWCL